MPAILLVTAVAVFYPLRLRLFAQVHNISGSFGASWERCLVFSDTPFLALSGASDVGRPALRV